MAERKTILVSEILPNIDRKMGGYGNLDTLAASIKEIGLINPITVRYESGDNEFPYTIIAGRRRLEAVKKLGLKNIEAVVYGEDESIPDEEIALAENVNRLDMHPVDEGANFKKLLKEGKTIDELSKTFDRSPSHIYQRIKLTELTDNMKEFFKQGKINITEAAKIACLPVEVQEKIYNEISKDKWFSGYADYAIRRYAKNRLDFPCSICKYCNKRTRYTDNNLFPELNERDDYCLDPECYEKEKIKLYKERIKEGVSNYGDLDFLFVNGVEKEYLIPLQKFFDFKIDLCSFNDYTQLDQGRNFDALTDEVRACLVHWYDVIDDKMKYVITYEDYNKYFRKNREVSEEEKLIIESLPDEYKEEAIKKVSKEQLFTYSMEHKAKTNTVCSLLKKEFLKPIPSFYLSDDFFDYLIDSGDNEFICNAFKIMTGSNLNNLKDTKRFNFKHIDFLNLFFYTYILRVADSILYKDLDETIPLLGLDVKEATKIFSEELKNIVIENLKKAPEDDEEDYDESDAETEDEESEDEDLTDDSFRSEEDEDGEKVCYI
ncbi:ParB/RepB/Spo0J family partition protein [Treponema sp. OMZ 799]|uniref:ParB/RepB/Spo0J family partition protein n=1 Tax=Treponema sp. OMZ 799 TaxID=2563668 RepID=UPI0020A2D745|nr:ParB/RepB/Spo0J family partition protein [Treponema sp. OMZ 799]UTC77581.1 ParB/RepB/Spo0J family partition protein [Treponema sp. OMZ 799]